MKTVAAVALLVTLVLPAQEPGRRAPVNPKAVLQEMGHGEGALKPGDLAPDFRLRKIKSNKKVRLSSFRSKKPVALIFGSYT
ncbi:MAG: hypothetical protein HYX27_00805 [Acidobacteria bacterium]|nr:hypothetical protein [Acidobacteriota bacterium]